MKKYNGSEKNEKGELKKKRQANDEGNVAYTYKNTIKMSNAS